MVYIAAVPLKGTTFEPGDVCPAGEWRTNAGLLGRGHIVKCEESEVAAVQHGFKTNPPHRIPGQRAGVLYVAECVRDYVKPKAITKAVSAIKVDAPSDVVPAVEKPAKKKKPGRKASAKKVAKKAGK